MRVDLLEGWCWWKLTSYYSIHYFWHARARVCVCVDKKIALIKFADRKKLFPKLNHDPLLPRPEMFFYIYLSRYTATNITSRSNSKAIRALYVNIR